MRYGGACDGTRTSSDGLAVRLEVDGWLRHLGTRGSQLSSLNIKKSTCYFP